MPEEIVGTPSEQDGQYLVEIGYNDETRRQFDFGDLIGIRQRSFDDVVYFALHDVVNNKHYEVDLTNGLFKINNQIFEFDLRIVEERDGNPVKVPSEELEFKPIYFRRVQEAGIIDKEREVAFSRKTIMPVFGWQVNYKNENHQRMIMIYPDGSLSIFNKK